MANDIGIKSLLTEINVIKNELKQRGDELKKLKLREKDIKAKISSFAFPKGFGISPVLFHLGPVSDALLSSRYFYRMIDIADL